jgi:hypothetical protein
MPGPPPAPAAPASAYRSARKNQGWGGKKKKRQRTSSSPQLEPVPASYALGAPLAGYGALPPPQPRPAVGDVCLVRCEYPDIPAATLWHRGTVVSLSSSFDGSLTFATEAETHVIRGAEHVFPAEATWSCSDSRAAVVIVRRAAAQPAAAATTPADLDPADDGTEAQEHGVQAAVPQEPATAAGGGDGNQGMLSVGTLSVGTQTQPGRWVAEREMTYM